MQLLTCHRTPTPGPDKIVMLWPAGTGEQNAGSRELLEPTRASDDREVPVDWHVMTG